ncbi:MAG: right-handed parallel beta-helix repeat-containing protein [Synechococcales bacterium]|nr:right-handed parallel beta-helix repeat-containing protein [Synechococcales bacterium]
MPTSWVRAADTTPMRITVNSTADTIQADQVLTLREAIHWVNGTRSTAQLSPAEKRQILGSPTSKAITIAFDLPRDRPTILLQELLPAIVRAKVTLDGTTQPGYQEAPIVPPVAPPVTTPVVPPALAPIATPIVTIAPAPDRTVLRGLTLAADQITVRGLAIQGFTGTHQATAPLPPADIFITRADSTTKIPEGIWIDRNWIGRSPDAQIKVRSAFGVVIFHGSATMVHQNQIVNHDGSGILTGSTAEYTQIIRNVIESNGFAGMPDAIRLEGNINGAEIHQNQILNNAGSGIYFFKTEGKTMIHHNQLDGNGQSYQRAAIYVMGKNHEIVRNIITQQSGSGVAVSAYPTSDRIRIQDNSFSKLQGLSIDLVSQFNTNPQDYQQGDGANFANLGKGGRAKTANHGIDAPEFYSREFFISPIQKTVTIEGKALPNAMINLYRVTEAGSSQGPLNQPLTNVEANPTGHFSITLPITTLQPGDLITAIALHPHYGTSEPALNATIQSLPPHNHNNHNHRRTDVPPERL